MAHLLGIDAGGTSVRAALCDTSGSLLGTGRAAGANRRSCLGEATRNLSNAIEAALAEAGLPPQRIGPATIGLAGAEAMSSDEIVALRRSLARDTGICADRIQVITDLEIAFHAGGVGATGTVLIAGTGAVAARFEKGRQVTRCDGLGWILGDKGSGLWIGLQALDAVAADLDGRGPTTLLTPTVLSHWKIGDHLDPRRALVTETHSKRPAQFGEFAPLVLDAARRGDREAQRIQDEAIHHLRRSLDVVGHRESEPLVLAGGMLADTAVADALVAAYPDATKVAHPVVGAILQSAHRDGSPLPPAAHRELVEALDARVPRR